MSISPQRILIVKLSAVGDVVHALPVLNQLRKSFPNAHLGWATHPGPANLLQGHPQLDELIILPRRKAQWKSAGGVRSVLECLRGQPAGTRWDYAIDLQGLTKSGVATLLSRARHRIGFAGAASRELNALFMSQRVLPSSTQVISMNLELLRPLGIEPSKAPAALLHTTAEDQEAIAAWADTAQVKDEKFLIIDPFAGWSTKLWPQDRWLSIITRIEKEHGLRSLVFYGPGESHEAQRLADLAIAEGAHPVLAPETSLRQYVALLSAHAAAFVGGDTGPMHIAAAAGIPAVAMYGPSDPRRNAPAFSNARYEILQDLTQPCANTFNRRCSYHPEPGGCLSGIPVDAVKSQIGVLLKA